jgi:hypothetical protein
VYACSYVRYKVRVTKVTGPEDLKTLIRDVIKILSTGMLARRWEELEFGLDVLPATQGAQSNCAERMKTMCIYT